MFRNLVRSGWAPLLAVVAAAGPGCGGPTPPAPPASTAGSAALPASLFAASPEPSGYQFLTQVRATARPGDQVFIQARVGGRRDPFVENRAVFSVADPELLSCDQLHGDGCKSPWDYCCEPKENLVKNVATIQVVDAAGQPLHVSLRGVHGLEPLKTVMILGTVERADEAGGFVVNATSIHVRPG